MSPLPRFHKLALARREAILAAAREEIARYGFEGASLNRILDQLQLSKGALYYYFADRDDLLRTVLSQSLDRLLAAMGPLGDVATPDEYWDGWLRMYERFLRCNLTDPVLAAINWSAIQARATGRAPSSLSELGEAMMHWTEGLLGLGRAVGAVRTDLPERLALHAAFGMLEGGDRWFAETWPSVRDADVEALARAVVSLLRRMIGIEEEPG